MDRLKYNCDNYKSFSFRLNREKESEIIDFIESRDKAKEVLLEKGIRILVDLNRQKRYKKWPKVD